MTAPVNDTLTVAQAIEYLEDRAEYYERANNHASNSKNYPRQECTDWKIAQILRGIPERQEPDQRELDKAGITPSLRAKMEAAGFEITTDAPTVRAVTTGTEPRGCPIPGACACIPHLDDRAATAAPEQEWPTHCIHGHPVNSPEWCPQCRSSNLIDPEVAGVAWAILQALHESVPEAERPMSWSDVAGNQEQRLRAAAVAAIEHIRKSPDKDRVEAAVAKAVLDNWNIGPNTTISAVLRALTSGQEPRS